MKHCQERKGTARTAPPIVNAITAVRPIQWKMLHFRSHRHVAGNEPFNDSVGTVRSNENELSYRWWERAWIEMEVFS